MQQPKKQTTAVMQGVGVCVGALMLLTAAPWAVAQTEPGPSVPTATPQLTVPLRNPLHRNPARRAQLPQTPPPPADPRDSSVRPVMPPGSSDGRDTVLSAPGQAVWPGAAASAPREP
jgi:hypothetical protein